MTQQVQQQQSEVSALRQELAAERAKGQAAGGGDAQAAQHERMAMRQQWVGMEAAWRDMMAEWGGICRSAKAMGEAEALRQSAEEKRWRAGEALAAAVLDAAAAEDARKYAERARLVVWPPPLVLVARAHAGRGLVVTLICAWPLACIAGWPPPPPLVLVVVVVARWAEMA